MQSAKRRRFVTPWASFLATSAVGVAAITDTVDSDGVGGFLEEDAVVADAKAEEAEPILHGAHSGQ